MLPDFPLGSCCVGGPREAYVSLYLIDTLYQPFSVQKGDLLLVERDHRSRSKEYPRKM